MWKAEEKWDNKCGKQRQSAAITVLISMTVTNRQLHYVTISYTKFRINRPRNVVITGRAAFAQISNIQLSVTSPIFTKQAWSTL